ncbi:2-hydroxyacid dehydrogenase [Pseudomonas chlororaphis]|uniref:2-hydroxyacid dehydrogenase n=1 Tax=Pseudomonas chlororaphis TaxID=587753 RepID=UPI00026E4988|nr:D-isomer specific 2-hydroxyacid dehydrogenase family protein [Pseudomonas chlororaphis subsp. aureofaciens 30-84]
MSERIKVVISGADRLAQRYISKLNPSQYEVVLIGESFPDQARVISAISDAHIYMHAGEEILTEEVLQQAGKLQLVACLASGAEHLVDIEAADRLGIAVTNTPGLKVMYEAMGEFLVGLVIALRRKLIYFHTEQKNGRLHETDTPLLKDAVIGIIGMGKVGSRVARMMHDAFNSRIVYTANSQKPEVERDTQAQRLALDALLETSDVVILACPYNGSTLGFIGEHELSLMKPSAILINTSESSLVDGQAVYEALVEEKIAGAAFDDKNWDAPPLIKDGKTINMPIEMLDLPDDRFICTPYVGAMTSAVWDEMASVAVGSILHFMEQGTDKNLYNRNLDATRHARRMGFGSPLVAELEG